MELRKIAQEVSQIEPFATEKYFSAQSAKRNFFFFFFLSSFPASKSNSVEIAYISYKNLRYILSINLPRKIDGRVLVPSPHVKACDFLGFVDFFFFLFFLFFLFFCFFLF